MRPSSARPLAASAAALMLVLAGCSGHITDPRALIAAQTPASSTKIVPDTPRALLDAFAHAWNNRDPVEYYELFTEDFQFVFAAADSSGQPFPDRCLTRELELLIAQHLFLSGTSSNPPAQKIVLTFDRTFIPEPDSRPGKTWPWHQEIKRNLVLSVDTGEQAFRITGAARFFVVRGDSAAIPPDLVARGFHPDPNWWYIERWEDETLDTGGGLPGEGVTPTASRTWGDLKVLYLSN